MKKSTNLLTCSGAVSSNARNKLAFMVIFVSTPEHHIYKNNASKEKKQPNQRFIA